MVQNLSNFRKGSVVLVSFANEKPVRRRVGLIVSRDGSELLDTLLVIPMKRGHEGISSDYFVTVSGGSSEGKNAGIREDTIIDCTVITTISKACIAGTLGQFTDETMNRVDECLKRVLDLSHGFGAPVPKKPYPKIDDTGAELALPLKFQNSEDTDR